MANPWPVKSATCNQLSQLENKTWQETEFIHISFHVAIEAAEYAGVSNIFLVNIIIQINKLKLPTVPAPARKNGK